MNLVLRLNTLFELAGGFWIFGYLKSEDYAK